MGGGECYDSSNDLGAQSAFPAFGTELVFADLKTKSYVTHKQYSFQCGGRGGGGRYNIIIDLGEE